MIAGTDYSMFIWQMGKQFRGRVEDHPHIPQQMASTALGVRDALQRLLVAAGTS
jgi:hypothetical protein